MRQTVKALAFLAALLPSLAVAQQPTLPPNTVLGRLGVSAGPAQAIPFSTLGPSLITSNLAVTAPLSISGLNLQIVGVAGKVLAGTPPAFTSTPTLGVASSLTGTLTLANSANSGTITLGAASTATSWTFKFPTTAGSNGQSLITDGAGNTSWAAGTGTVNSGTAGQLTYYATTAAAVSGNANLTVSAGALTVGVAGSQAGTVLLSGGTSGATTLAGPASGGGVMTFPAGADTVMSLAASQTATNKTFTSPVINGGTLNSVAINARDNTFVITGSVDATKRVFFEVDGLTTATDRTVTVPDADITIVGTTNVQVVSNKGITGSTFNGNSWTAGSGTLTIGAGKIFTVSNTLTLTAGADGQTFAFPSASDTVVTLTAAQTLTTKVLTAPTINGGTAQALTNLGIRSTGTGAFDLVLANTENLTAQRTLTLAVNNAARTINLSGNLTLGADLTVSGANAITFTTVGATNVTLPTSGTLATINTAQTFSSPNIFSTVQQFTDAKFSSGKIYPTSDSTTALQVTKADGTTRVVNFDTTNARVGINKTAGAFDLDVNGAVNVGSTLTFSTLDSGSLGTSTSTITGLTVNNSPSSSNDYIPYYSAVDGRIRKATVGAIAAGATAGVSSLNGLTGGLSIVQGAGLQLTAVGTSITLTADVTQPSLQNYLSGLGLANNVSDATNDIDISTGIAADTTNTVLIKLASALTKRTDASWVVGTNQGCWDTGSVANGTIHWWLIRRSDTGVVDVLCSGSASAPTMPASYDAKRRIGSILRQAAALLPFNQIGNDFWLLTSLAETSITTLTTASMTITLANAPTGVAVTAHLNFYEFTTAAGSAVYVRPLFMADVAATTATVNVRDNSAGSGMSTLMSVPLNTSAQFAARAQTGTITAFNPTVRGWNDTRGQ